MKTSVRQQLSRERIVEAAVALLDARGEDALTFRALAQRLATGAGAIYWHIADKDDLLAAACDAIVTRILGDAVRAGEGPEDAIRGLALAVFDAIDAHPWVGSALVGTSALSPIVRVLERLGQQIRAMAVPEEQQWAAAGTLMAYILGVSTQNAANGQIARARELDRTAFLESVSTAWSRLDAQQYPFTRSVAARMRDHDDRADYLAGIDLILKGIGAAQSNR